MTRAMEHPFTATAGFTHIAAATPSASPTSTISTCAWSTLCATAALGLSLYNIYNRQNITDVYVSYDNVTAKPFLKGVCKLPFLPSVDYTIKF